MGYHSSSLLQRPSKERLILSNFLDYSHRYGHNLDLSKSKTQKINNINTIYYNKDEEIMFDHQEKREIM